MKRSIRAAAAALVVTCVCTHLDSACAFTNNNARAREPIRHIQRIRGYQTLVPLNELAAQSASQENDNIDNINRRDFSPEFQLEFEALLHWRRDVRRFQKDKAVDEEVLNRALTTAFRSAPSVGLSEPWRIVRVESEAAREAVLSNFEIENDKALQGYDGEKRQKYASLKLSGMREAPVQLAIFCDDGTAKGAGLGAQTMPEMKRYSVVSAITLFWLAARCARIGVGWVSILDALKLREDLGVSSDYVLVGYLCVGYPEEDNDSPELERYGWEKRMASDDFVITSV